MKTWKTVITKCAFLASLAAGASFAHAVPGDYVITRSFPAPVPSPDGIFWDGTHVWTTECTSEDIYRLDPTNGSIVEKYTIPGSFLDHMEWDGRNLWGNDHHGGSLLRKIDLETLEVTENIEIPFENLMGVAWDGSHLWTTNPSTIQLVKVDPATGEIDGVLDFDFPDFQLAEQTCGIGWDGVCLWVGDIVNRKYHQVDPATGEVVLTIIAPGGEESLPTGFAWNGSNMWVVDENPNNPTIFLLDVELLDSGPCAHGARLGEECGGETGLSCVDGLPCVGGATPNLAGICRTPCDRSAEVPCGEGSTCWQLDSKSAACLPDPPEGPTGNFGDPCVGKAQCQSNLCIDGPLEYLCTELCVGGEEGTCPEGHECAAGALPLLVCLPVVPEEPEEVAADDVQADADTPSIVSESGGADGGCTTSRPFRAKGGATNAASFFLLLAAALSALLRSRNLNQFQSTAHTTAEERR